MTESEINELRSRIIELEQSDEIFARRANLLLDEILLTRDQVDGNTRAIEKLTTANAEGRRDIDQLAQRIGELAQSVSELRQDQQLLTFTVSQLAESMTILRQTQQITMDAFVRSTEQANADRAVMREMLQYLRNQYPSNGRGEQGGEG